jgi:hypothetical protein
MQPAAPTIRRPDAEDPFAVQVGGQGTAALSGALGTS